jgi:asparagine synthetase A
MADKQIKQWKREAVIAYHTAAYEGFFELYWDMTESLRIDESIDWNKVKQIKFEAWQKEEAKHESSVV